MRAIKIIDTTLTGGAYTFKEKLAIARQLEDLHVDAIELPIVTTAKADEVLVRTMASFVRDSRLSLAVNNDESLAVAMRILEGIPNAVVRVEVPVSTVGMEYFHQKKAPKMVEWIGKAVRSAKQKYTVEFCALDATRAERDVLLAAVQAAAEAGADWVTITDEAGEVLPDDFASLVNELVAVCPVSLGVRCRDKGLAVAGALLAIKAGATLAKAGVDNAYTDLETLVGLLHDAGPMYDLSIGLDATRLHRIVNQVRTVSVPETIARPDTDGTFVLSETDDKARVMEAVAKIGYDLGAEEQAFVYEEFLRVAKKKKVGAKELQAIVESVATQYPAVYKLDSYVINNGNIITSSAQITVLKDNAVLHGVSIGDGPVDAAFRALEQIVGAHYELDDFQIHAVTEGREAVGQAQVKLRWDGKVFIGNGVSTDIIGASIRAYLSAVNKIVYEAR